MTTLLQLGVHVYNSGLILTAKERPRKDGQMKRKYRKISIISPGLIFVQKAVLLGSFSGEVIVGGAYYWKEFCVSKWVGLDNKNSVKHYENSLKQLALSLAVHGLTFRRAYHQKDFCV